jgi:hypothetical protein
MEVLLSLILIVLMVIAFRLGTIAKQQRNLSAGWATVVDQIMNPIERGSVRGEPARYPFSYLSGVVPPRSVIDQLGQALEQVCVQQEEIKEVLQEIRRSQEYSAKSYFDRAPD